jgi:hypothetical protein
MAPYPAGIGQAKRPMRHAPMAGRVRGRACSREWPDEGALSNSGSTLFAFYGEPRGRAGTGSQMSRRFVSPEGWEALRKSSG